MNTPQRLEEMKESFFRFVSKGDSEIDLEELNEFAAFLAEDVHGPVFYEFILSTLIGRKLSDDKSEYLCISIFELLAEPPVHELWMRNLSFILGNESLWWIIARSYKYFPSDLIAHIKILSEER